MGIDGAGESKVDKEDDILHNRSKSPTNATRTEHESAAQWARQNYAPFSHLMFPRHELDRALEAEAIRRMNVENDGHETQ